MKPKPHNTTWTAVLILAWLGVIGLSILIGLKIGGSPSLVSWSDLFGWVTGRDIDPTIRSLLVNLRLPRVLLALLTGAVLSVSGVVYQALLRNPLAEPYTLGVSGGATLGAVLAIALSIRAGYNHQMFSLPVIPAAALTGGLITIALIYLLARRWGIFSSSTVILAGVALNLVFGSLILLMQYLSDYTQIYEMIRWMMGGLDAVGYKSFQVLVPISLIGGVIIFTSMRQLDLLAVDPEMAATLGIRVESTRWRLLLTASLMTGAIVAFSGPIGFVGLIGPHCVRMIFGATHSRVLPWSAATGAIFLLACDTLSQNILPQEDIPLGVLTAMVGGPFFVLLLLNPRMRAGVWSD